MKISDSRIGRLKANLRLSVSSDNLPIRALLKVVKSSQRTLALAIYLQMLQDF